MRDVDLSTSKQLKAGAKTLHTTEPPNADRRVLAAYYTFLNQKQEINVETKHQYWENKIRKEKANNIEEAVGKFMINTQNVYAIQRLNPIAYELSQVLSL